MFLEPFSLEEGGLGSAWLGLMLRAAGSPRENCLVSGLAQIPSYQMGGGEGEPEHWHRAPEDSASSPPSPQLQAWRLGLIGGRGWGDQQQEARGLLCGMGGRGRWRQKLQTIRSKNHLLGSLSAFKASLCVRDRHLRNSSCTLLLLGR